MAADRSTLARDTIRPHFADARPPRWPAILEGSHVVTETDEITRLLHAFRDGDRSAFDRLFALVYDDLRRRARFQLRESGGASLATTGLVHEAYLKLVGAGEPDWEGRRHFYRVAARAMRQIVIDHARRHRAAKRGGGGVAIDVEQAQIPVRDASSQLLALDRALTRLEEESPDAARVVELTYFTGLTVEEAAEVAGTSPRTVKRLRQFGRAFLHSELSEERDS
jgi:RNA polymerase sigma factor (TIGR02999 family)